MPGLDDDYIMSSKVRTLSVQFGIVQRLESCHDQFMHQVKMVDLVGSNPSSTVSGSSPALKSTDTDTGLWLSPVSPLSGQTQEDSGLFLSPTNSLSGPTDTNSEQFLSTFESPIACARVLEAPNEDDSGLFLEPSTPASLVRNNGILHSAASYTCTDTSLVNKSNAFSNNKEELESIENRGFANVNRNLSNIFINELSEPCDNDEMNNSVKKYKDSLISRLPANVMDSDNETLDKSVDSNVTGSVGGTAFTGLDDQHNGKYSSSGAVQQGPHDSQYVTHGSSVTSQKENSSYKEEWDTFKSSSTVDYNYTPQNGNSLSDSQFRVQGTVNANPDVLGQISLKRRMLENPQSVSHSAQLNISDGDTFAWKLAKVEDSDFSEEQDNVNLDWEFLYEDSLLSPIMEENVSDVSVGFGRGEQGFFVNKQNLVSGSSKNHMEKNIRDNIEIVENSDIQSLHSESSDGDLSPEENFVAHCEIFLQGTQSNQESLLTHGSRGKLKKSMGVSVETTDANPEIAAQPELTDSTSPDDFELQQNFNDKTSHMDNNYACGMDMVSSQTRQQHVYERSPSDDVISQSVCDGGVILDVESPVCEGSETNSSANSSVCEYIVNESLSEAGSPDMNVSVSSSNNSVLKTTDDQSVLSEHSSRTEVMSPSAADKTNTRDNHISISELKPEALFSNSADVINNVNLEESVHAKEQDHDVHRDILMSRNEWTAERCVLLNNQNSSSAERTKSRKTSDSSSQLYVSRLKEKFESENDSTKQEEKNIYKKSSDKIRMKPESKCKSLENLYVPAGDSFAQQHMPGNSSLDKSVDAAQTNEGWKSAETTDSSSHRCKSFHNPYDFSSTTADSTCVLNRGKPHHRSLHDIKTSDKESSEVNSELESKRSFSFFEIKKCFEKPNSYYENRGSSTGTEQNISTSRTPSNKVIILMVLSYL